MRRSFVAPLEINDRIVEGCCVPYGEASEVRDHDDSAPYWEVFEPGAFRKQLNAASRVELDYEHRDDLASSIGVCRSLHEEANGLFGSFSIHRGAFGDQAIELVREGILPGFSVLFTDRFTNWSRSADGTVVRRNCALHKVALCRTPAYAGALVTAMRSAKREDFELPTIDTEQLDRLRAVGIEVISRENRTPL
jgi:HK97 family phage prohead protease